MEIFKGEKFTEFIDNTKNKVYCTVFAKADRSVSVYIASGLTEFPTTEFKTLPGIFLQARSL